MSKNLHIAPTARSWRDIPQPVKPRAMSREGKWRLMTSVLRAMGATLVMGGVAWGLWEVTRGLQETPRKMPETARAVAIKQLELRTDGVLDNAWLARTLALPKQASLMEVDLQSLRLRLMASGQVNAATLTKNFPDTLKVQVGERSPVARVMANWRGESRALVVARDGVVFEGVGYGAAMLATLPWLDGVKLTRTADQYQPVENMGLVAELLARARLDAEHLYQTWQVVSLARLESDGTIEIRTKPGTTVVFGVNGDFLQQLAKLDYQWEALATAPNPPRKIDLSLGREVSVSFQPLPNFNLVPHSQPKTKL